MLHTGDLLVDIYIAKYGAYLHFTVVLNDGGKGAQFRRNGCSICAVEVRNLGRNTQDTAQARCSDAHGKAPTLSRCIKKRLTAQAASRENFIVFLCPLDGMWFNCRECWRYEYHQHRNNSRGSARSCRAFMPRRRCRYSGCPPPRAFPVGCCPPAFGHPCRRRAAYRPASARRGRS